MFAFVPLLALWLIHMELLWSLLQTVTNALPSLCLKYLFHKGAGCCEGFGGFAGCCEGFACIQFGARFWLVEPEIIGILSQNGRALS